MTTHVSVIIPNLDSPVIDRTLSALRGQDFDLSKVEVLVVGLDEPGLVQVDELVSSISTGRPEPPGVARNIGVRESNGDLLCFTDADCVPHPGWLRSLARCHAEPEVTIVGGGVAFPPNNYWRLADNISTFHPYLHTSPPGIRDQLPSLNLSIQRRTWDEVGPFDERYSKAGEDVDWTTRARLAGHRLRFEPRAVVTHIPQRTTFADLWHHAVGFGQYSVKLDSRYQGVLWKPFVLKHWLLTLLAAPVMAGWVTARAFSQRSMLRYAHTIPAVFVAKVGWCWGAAQRLRGTAAWSRALPSDSSAKPAVGKENLG
jgi:glycosyltransferase involved in cell wall biosynthesis